MKQQGIAMSKEEDRVTGVCHGWTTELGSLNLSCQTCISGDLCRLELCLFEIGSDLGLRSFSQIDITPVDLSLSPLPPSFCVLTSFHGFQRTLWVSQKLHSNQHGQQTWKKEIDWLQKTGRRETCPPHFSPTTALNYQQ